LFSPFPPPAGLPGTAQIIPLKTLLSNLSAAVVTVQKLTHQLVPGKVWTMRAPAGEIEGEPEASWVFPVALGNTIVAHLKVYYDGVHIVPDYPANQEMAYYGQ
jgi:hypothetical protein